MYRKAWRQPQPGNRGYSRTMKCFGSSTSLIASDIAVANNTVGLFRVPAEFVVLSTMLVIPSLDSGAPKALLLGLGDGENPQRLMAVSNIGQNGASTDAMLPQTSWLYYYPKETEIQLYVAVPAATPLPGTLKFYLQGFMC